MKFKVTISALFLAAFTFGSAQATERYAESGGPGAAPCTVSTPGSRCTLAAAIAASDPGDTINLLFGTYTVGEIDITKDFLTIRGPNYLKHADGTTDGARDPEAEFTGSGHEYIFGIGAHNVTIEGIEIDTSGSTDTWAGIRILVGGWDRWAIRNNLIHDIDDMKDVPGSGVSNFSFGIYGDAQTTAGSLSMTGGSIHGNYIHTLGFGSHVGGANVTSGVGIYLEGVEGDVDDCDYINVFTCGVWIYDNDFEHLYTGQSQVLQGITTPGGKEYSHGVFVAQDSENTLPNNGVWVGGNTTLGPVADGNMYLDDDSATHGTPDEKLEIGVRVGVGGSMINEINGDFNVETVAMVVNEGRAATVSELILAPFFKSLFPRVFGEGTDLYTRWNADAKDLSDASATIVEVALTGADVDLTVRPQGSSASYKVSLDNGGDFNLRFGARLLFSAPLANGVDGVNTVKLFGTTGDDLLTVDFNNGNPIPNKVVAGLTFNPDSAAVNGGFDGIALRGDEQLDYETVVMTAADAGTIHFNPDAPAADEPPVGFTTLVSGGQLVFDNLEPIDDVLIVNTKYSVVATDDVDNEINIINGPFRFGFDTFQINSGAVKTFEEINFSNKKNVHIYGADDTGAPGDGDDVFTVFTEDGDAPDLILSLTLWGGSDFGGGAAEPDDASDDYFVVRPSKDYQITVDGGEFDSGDYLFLDCANTHDTCQPSLLHADLITAVPSVDGDTGAAITGFETVFYRDIETAPSDLTGNDIVIKKELVGFAASGAHPGDDLEYRVTLYNFTGGALDLASGDSLWVTDAIDHRLSLIEQSVVTEAGTVDVTSNRSMLWLLEGFTFADKDSISMTYDVIVNTLITTGDITNYASILNADDEDEQNLSAFITGGAYYEHYAKVDLELLDVFGYPLKAAINTALFFETEAGPRYMVGLNGGAKDPTAFGLGAVLCRVPDRNQAVGWDGGLGNLWYSCGEGLPSNGGIPEPLIVTDMYLDSADRIWLSSWGHSGLFYSDDGGQTWTDAMVDLSGGQGGAPDGIADGFAQIYAITEDILGTLFISANTGDVYRSFDRGVTWQRAKQLPMGSADTAFSMQADPTLPGTLYAGTFGDSLYVTNDFGETWTRPDGTDLGSGYIFDIEFDPLSGNLFVGTALGIYYSPDGGDTWTGLNSAFPIPAKPPEVRNIAFDENGVLFASTWGQGVWTSVDWQATSLAEFALKTSNVIDITMSDGRVYILTDTGEYLSVEYDASFSSVDIEEDGVEIPRGFTLDQNYPNPFNPVTTIQFTLPETADINLTVFDILGRQVAVLVNGQLSSGRHSVNFQASSLPSGIYLYRLTTPGGSVAQKMILLK